jgi:hypothetical protein
MVAPLVTLDVLHGVEIPTWNAFFEAFGHPRGAARGIRTHDAIGAALDPPPPVTGGVRKHPQRLLGALAALRELSTWQARDAVYDAARALAIDMTAWPLDVGDAELAARWILAARESAGIRDALALARIDLRQTTRPHPFRYFRARRPAAKPAPRPWADVLRDLASVASDLDAAARALGRLSHSAARACVDPDAPSSVVIELCRADPPRPRIAVGKQAPRAVVQPGSIAIDLVVVDVARDHVAVRTDNPRLLSFHRERIGVLIWGDQDHYGSEPTCNLRVLQELGAAGLEVPALRASITRVRVIRLTWDDGKSMVHHDEGDDVLAHLAAKGEAIAHGTVLAATIRVSLVGDESVDVHLRIPNRLHYEPSPHDALIETFLEETGLSRPDPSPPDLWRLAPWIHPKATWVAAFGEAWFDAAVKGRVLCRSESRALVHPDHPHAGRTLIAFPWRRDTRYGVSEDVDVSSALLPLEALSTWRLDPVALGRRLARELALEGDVRGLEAPGLVDLGHRQLARTRVRVFMAAAMPNARLMDELTDALAAPLPAVVLVPRGRRAGGRAREIAFDPCGHNGGVFREIVFALKLHDEVDALSAAPAEARVVVDTRHERAWLDGVLLDLNPTDFALLAALARAGGQAVSNEELGKLVGSSKHTVADKKLHLLHAMRESFSAQGKEPPADLAHVIDAAGRKQGYRLTVAEYVR